MKLHPRRLGAIATIALFVSAPAALGQETPGSITLTGVVRDFQAEHPDFEVVPEGGSGVFAGNIRPTLGDDGKPVFVGCGYKIETPWTNMHGEPIMPALFDAARGDIAGTYGVYSNGGIASESSFAEWYVNRPGVNISAPLSITLNLNDDGVYVFDDREDPFYSTNEGFFPIDDRFFGNSGNEWHDHNYHFTYELHTTFVYDATGTQTFRFRGDDDVFVFINGQLVIDLNGIHVAQEQVVDLHRLGLTDGETCTLDFFFAERRLTQSNFRIETTLQLSSPPERREPTFTLQYD